MGVNLKDHLLKYRKYTTWSRAKVYSEMARLVFIVEYYLKNYKNNTNKNR